MTRFQKLYGLNWSEIKFFETQIWENNAEIDLRCAQLFLETNIQSIGEK